MSIQFHQPACTFLELLLCATILNACTNGQSKSQTERDLIPRFDLTTGISETSLQPYVGRHVIVTGFWDSRGKESGYVYGGKDSQSEIYVKATDPSALAMQSQLENSIHDGTAIQVEGVLNASPEVKTTDPSAQNPGSYLFFDVKQARVTVLKK